MAAADADVRVLEEGEMRLLIVLAPHGRRTHRLLSIGRKRLPDPSERGRERFWGVVGRVGAADDAGAWSAAHHDSEVTLPPDLIARFRGRRYAEADRPEFLDYAGQVRSGPADGGWE